MSTFLERRRQRNQMLDRFKHGPKLCEFEIWPVRRVDVETHEEFVIFTIREVDTKLYYCRGCLTAKKAETWYHSIVEWAREYQVTTDNLEPAYWVYDAGTVEVDYDNA